MDTERKFVGVLFEDKVVEELKRRDGHQPGVLVDESIVINASFLGQMFVPITLKGNDHPEIWEMERGSTREMSRLWDDTKDQTIVAKL